jgi:hypothetical protein
MDLLPGKQHHLALRNSKRIKARRDSMGETMKIKCGHNTEKDFSYKRNFFEKVEHFYCSTCGAHFEDGKFYTREQWEIETENSAIMENRNH